MPRKPKAALFALAVVAVGVSLSTLTNSAAQDIPIPTAPTLQPPSVAPKPPCTGTTQRQFKAYAARKYTNWRRPLVSRKAKLRMAHMRSQACTQKASSNMLRVQHGLAAYRPKPPVGTIHHCVLSSESGFSPVANNGSHFGIGQWDLSTWGAHGGRRFASSPLGATYREQLYVFVTAFDRYGCSAWCPYDPC